MLITQNPFFPAFAFVIDFNKVFFERPPPNNMPISFLHEETVLDSNLSRAMRADDVDVVGFLIPLAEIPMDGFTDEGQKTWTARKRVVYFIEKCGTAISPDRFIVVAFVVGLEQGDIDPFANENCFDFMDVWIFFGQAHGGGSLVEAPFYVPGPSCQIVG